MPKEKLEKQRIDLMMVTGKEDISEEKHESKLKKRLQEWLDKHTYIPSDLRDELRQIIREC